MPGSRRRRRTSGCANAKAGQAAIDRITQEPQRISQPPDWRIRRHAPRTSRELLIRVDPTNAKLQKRLTGGDQEAERRCSQQRKSLNESNAAAAKAAAKAAHDAAVQAAADRKQAQKDANERRNAAETRRQFKAIGLTAEGLKPTPGAGSLLQRTLGLKQQIKGTVLDTPKTTQQLDKISQLPQEEHGEGQARRARGDPGHAQRHLWCLRGQGREDTGPLTKTHGLSTAQIIKNLGLTQSRPTRFSDGSAHATTTSRAQTAPTLPAARRFPASAVGLRGRSWWSPPSSCNSTARRSPARSPAPSRRTSAGTPGRSAGRTVTRWGSWTHPEPVGFSSP